MGELESAIGTDPNADVVEAGPGIVVRSEQHCGFHLLTVANAKRLGRRTRHVLLDVFEVNIDGRVATGTMPILEDVGVAVDDHFAHADDYRMYENDNLQLNGRQSSSMTQFASSSDKAHYRRRPVATADAGRSL